MAETVDAVDAARGPVVIRRRLGSALKRYRHSEGLDLSSVARKLEVSPAKISRLETGQVAPKIRDVRDLLEIYGVEANERDRMMDWAQGAKDQGWWEPVPGTVPFNLDLLLSLEAEAWRCRTFSGSTFSGLLQTKEYARMVLQTCLPHVNDNERRKLLDIRLKRRGPTIDRDRTSGADPMVLHLIFDEAALYRGPDSSVMTDQLLNVLRASHRTEVGPHGEPRMKIQCFPFTAGFDEALSPFTIFEPRWPDDGIVVGVESTEAHAYYDDERAAIRYDEIWQDLRIRSLTHEETQDRLRKALTDRGLIAWDETDSEPGRQAVAESDEQ